MFVTDAEETASLAATSFVEAALEPEVSQMALT
jgi:hypothetical protein